MAYQFASPEWVAALKDAINQSDSYRESAKNWEGDFWFVVEPDEARPQRVFMYVDLWHGECRAAALANESDHTPEFRIWGGRKSWHKVISKEIDPIRALMTNTLKLKGNLAKIMRNVRAAQELVLCAASVPTEF